MRHWPGGSDARSVLLAAGDLATTSRRGADGYQAYGGCRGGFCMDRYPRRWAGGATATAPALR
jgi:hypothetical protein